MTFELATILNAFATMPLWEVIAVILGVAYVILAAKESVWCWVAAFFSTLIYTILFWEGQLLSSALLNFYYMGMAIYGYILWQKGNGVEENSLTITSWSRSRHLTAIITSAVFSLLVGYLLTTYTEARLPYLDAAVMIFSVLATWMLAHKILETWIYWIIIDIAAITLYWSTGYYVTIILFMVYVILAIYGYISWHKSKSETFDGFRS